jgi:hypothetical protein
VGSFVPAVKGDYTIKHSAGNNTGTNAFSINTAPATQLGETAGLVYTSDGDRLQAADSEKTYTDVTLEAGVRYYFSVWSGGGSNALWHFLEVTGAPSPKYIDSNSVTNWPGTAGQTLQSNGDETFTFV